jgi:hypothetical protein
VAPSSRCPRLEERSRLLTYLSADGADWISGPGPRPARRRQSSKRRGWSSSPTSGWCKKHSSTPGLAVDRAHRRAVLSYPRDDSVTTIGQTSVDGKTREVTRFAPLHYAEPCLPATGMVRMKAGVPIPVATPKVSAQSGHHVSAPRILVRGLSGWSDHHSDRRRLQFRRDALRDSLDARLSQP